jgi:hypothetical protein
MNLMSFVHNNLKTVVLLAGFCPLFAQAQEANVEDQKSPSLFKVSVLGGGTFSFTDVTPSQSAGFAGVGLEYGFAKFLSVGVDVNKGSLKGGVAVNEANKDIMGFKSDIFSAVLTARFMPFALIKQKNNKSIISILSYLYGGTGLGMVSYKTESNQIANPDYGVLNEEQRSDFLLPVEVGFGYPVASFGKRSKLFVNLNYRVNLCLGDEIDGYVPTVTANEKNDAFNTFGVGIGIGF